MKIFPNLAKYLNSDNTLSDQCLLAFSSFTTALAALAALLGKGLPDLAA